MEWLVFLSFLIWNVFNETLLKRYGISNNKKFQKLWHLYDATFRTVLFSIVSVFKYGFTIKAGLMTVILLLLYHVLFDLLFNLKTIRDLKRDYTFSNIFHVGSGTIDKYIVSIGKFINKLFIKTEDNVVLSKVIQWTGISIKIIELIVVIILL